MNDSKMMPRRLEFIAAINRVEGRGHA